MPQPKPIRRQSYWFHEIWKNLAREFVVWFIYAFALWLLSFLNHITKILQPNKPWSRWRYSKYLLNHFRSHAKLKVYTHWFRGQKEHATPTFLRHWKFQRKNGCKLINYWGWNWMWIFTTIQAKREHFSPWKLSK